jgi:uncharacterized protein YukJ
MKKSIAILLLIAISFQSFSKVFIVVNFIVNQSTIAQKYCVNKAKPKLHCDGKCHLKKQLKEEDKKENNISSNELKEKAESHFFVEISYSCKRNISTPLTTLTLTLTLFSPLLSAKNYCTGNC